MGIIRNRQRSVCAKTETATSGKEGNMLQTSSTSTAIEIDSQIAAGIPAKYISQGAVPLRLRSGV